MAGAGEIFGTRIIDSDRLPYVQQIYDAMRRQIHNGRWKVGDRLPGVKELADSSGQMIKTVQTVYRMLSRDGYIRSEDRRGTFLISRTPRNVKSRGLVGILLSREQESEHVSRYYVHELTSEALRHGYLVETRAVEGTRRFDTYSDLRDIFGRNLKGLLILYPFQFPRPAGEAPVPWVYLCQQDENLFPLVAVDVKAAFRELVRRLALMGHEGILLCVERPGSRLRFFPREEGIVSACREALSEAGLSIHPVRELQIMPNEYHAVERFVSSRPRNITAIVCNTVFLACAMSWMLLKKGVKVPDEVSVASLGSLPVWETDGRIATGGMLQDDHLLARTCFDLLLERIESGRCPISKVVLMPAFLPGGTIAGPR